MEFSTPATQRSSSSEMLAIQPGSVRSPAADAANDFARHLAENAKQRSNRRDDHPVERRERSATPERTKEREDTPRTRDSLNENREQDETISGQNNKADGIDTTGQSAISPEAAATTETSLTGQDQVGLADETSLPDAAEGTQAAEEADSTTESEESDTAIAAAVATEATSVQEAATTGSAGAAAKVAADGVQQQVAASTNNEGAGQGTAAITSDVETNTTSAEGAAQPKKQTPAQRAGQSPITQMQAQTAANTAGEFAAAEAGAEDLPVAKTEKGLGGEAAEKLAEKKSGDKQAAAQTNHAVTTPSQQQAARNSSPAPQTTQPAPASGAAAAPNSDQALPSLQQTNSSGNTTTIRIGTLPGQSQPTQIPANTIALQMARNLQKGTNRFDIRLDPPEMGRIDVRMEVRKDGHVAAHMSVDRPETLDLLQRDARALQQALNNAGLQADSDSLNFSLRDQANDDGARDFADGDKGSNMTDDDAGIETPPTPIYNINLAANGGVDIRI
ncbi:flagellar hook-length control protein FliK [Parvibaculum sp.]|uniref:flagellar hook-length control protein FliK n=1 Tax=Parvibaculum sp. TaxID=2024848 RepID=UPI0032979894